MIHTTVDKLYIRTLRRPGTKLLFPFSSSQSLIRIKSYSSLQNSTEKQTLIPIKPTTTLLTFARPSTSTLKLNKSTTAPLSAHFSTKYTDTMSESKKIAILLGSGRQNSNTAGMSLWLQSLAATIFPPTTTISVIDTTSPFFPSGVLSDAVMPALIRDPKLYAEELTRAWSTFVTSCDGFIVLTPQYNWGYPGSLKNALDHLYWEWKGKPVMIATFGGHGGGKCAAQLTEVMEGGLKMKVVSRSAITLPREYIREDARVKKSEDGSFDGWLKEYEEGTKGALEQFWKGVLEPPAPAEEERRRG